MIMMKRSGSFCALSLALGLVVAGSVSAEDAKVDVSKLPAPAKKAGVTYDKDIKPIVERSCLKCHSGDRPKGRYNMSTREGVLKGGHEGVAVKAGKSAESPIVHYVADLVPEYEMPPIPKRNDFPVLKKEEVALLRAWIDQGAK
jgi:hypothetical protein